MNFLFSLILAFLMVLLFQLVEKKRLFRYSYHDLFFVFLLTGCSYLLPPSHHIGTWVGLLPLFYCVLDDLHTKTAYSLLPIGSLIIFLILSFNWLSLLLSLFIFIFFYVFSHRTDESFVGIGDAFFVLPLTYLLGLNAPLGLLLSATLAGTVFSAVRFFRHEPFFAFFPALFIGCFIVYTNWHVSLFLGWSLGLFVFFSLILFLINHRKRN